MRFHLGADSQRVFFGPDSYYMNWEANAAYHEKSVNGHVLDMPVLFVESQYDYWCESTVCALGDDMRRHCPNLTSVTIASGHWVQQERPVKVNSALMHWLATSAKVWPALPPVQWVRAAYS